MSAPTAPPMHARSAAAPPPATRPNRRCSTRTTVPNTASAPNTVNADVDAPYPYAVYPKRSKAYDPTTGAAPVGRANLALAVASGDASPDDARSFAATVRQAPRADQQQFLNDLAFSENTTVTGETVREIG